MRYVFILIIIEPFAGDHLVVLKSSWFCPGVCVCVCVCVCLCVCVCAVSYTHLTLPTS